MSPCLSPRHVWGDYVLKVYSYNTLTVHTGGRCYLMAAVKVRPTDGYFDFVEQVDAFFLGLHLPVEVDAFFFNLAVVDVLFDEIFHAHVINYSQLPVENLPGQFILAVQVNAVDGPAGFDFLGFNFRQYPRGKNRCMHRPYGEPVGFKVHVKPSLESQKRFQRKVREIVHGNRNVRQLALIRLLNPVIRGWGNYFSTVVSKDIFGKMDMLIFKKLWTWARRRHPNKGRRWVARKYWLGGKHGWTFGVDGVIALHKLSHIPIRRHVPVRKAASPFDGNALYWSIRTGAHPEIPQSLARLLRVQNGHCPGCGLYFHPGDRFKIVRRSGCRTTGQRVPAMLMHEHCQ